MSQVGKCLLSVLGICIFVSCASASSVQEYYVLPMASLEESKDACRSASFVPPVQKKWLGMVQKGGCSTLSKYNTLREMGASGMLILDGGETEYTSTSRFHVVSIEASMYKRLVEAYEKNKELPKVKISHPYTSTLPAVQILYIVFLVLMIFVFPSLFERLDEPAVKLVTPKDLSTVSLEKYERLPEKDRKYEECPICFDRFQPEDFVRTLQCRHYYHCNCIDPWLLSRSCRCPVCNQELSFP
ncbi:uncharacterized protein NEMAJ01_0618 [Nematocida major]|uniref:uncharacterized protein n=1 Tax=Nematocida major TaxID=1912982 RepID=UPI00200884DF|nr:uncharacterized protein NEMAJ01_0618 [Nematocida major]KAH9385722.1 hypothetical protein NEMAJ01_0618 [Nematocida major]